MTDEKINAFYYLVGEQENGRSRESGKLPIDKKLLLSIQEAAEYSNIGINKINTLLGAPNCPFVLFVGNKKLEIAIGGRFGTISMKADKCR